jgi:AhpD family alkylhydroperoxidase
MTGERTKADRFTEVLGAEVDSAFKKLASVILKEGILTIKDKALIALACSVAVRCESCILVNRRRALAAGASQEEILEAAAVAGLVRLGSGFNAASVLLEGKGCERCQVP